MCPINGYISSGRTSKRSTLLLLLLLFPCRASLARLIRSLPRIIMAHSRCTPIILRSLSRPGESPQYYMTPLKSFSLTDSSRTFRQGVGAFRNAGDLAKEQRDILIDQANTVARAQSADTMSFDDSNSQNTVTSLRGRLIDSDTSADELALDYPSTMFRTKRQKKEQTRPGTPRSMREEPSSNVEDAVIVDV